MSRYNEAMPSSTKLPARELTRAHRPLLCLALLLCLSALTGCKPDEGEKHIGRQLTKLHEQINGEETSAIWNAADDGFRQGISKQECARLFVRNHRKLGDAGAGILLDTDVYTSFKGNYITQTLITDFANDPEARERVVWFGKDGVYKLYRYDVSSKLLQ